MWVKFTQTKNGLSAFVLPLDEVHGPVGDVVVDRHHPRLGQRAGVLAHLLADLAEARIDRRVVRVRGLAVHHAARSVLRSGLILGFGVLDLVSGDQCAD